MNNDVVGLGFDLTQILGRTEEDALELLKAANRDARVEFRDGKAVPHILNLSTGRVNLNVVDGLV